MRRENSAFNMKFKSEPGIPFLHNNDYYGCSEQENFACYVVADGFKSGDSKLPDSSARIAVEAVIAAFNHKPSISRNALNRYIQAAHNTLKNDPAKRKLRASITIAVTDYRCLRYAYAGNSRFNLYRNGSLIEESRDHSLSWEMMEDRQIPKDRVALHDERNNLKIYLGQTKSFLPAVSKKIKLKETDIFSLFTRGIWENADTNDIQVALQAAENDPEAAVDNVERLILDKAPKDGIIENYTLCVVFVDKIYVDPNEGKRLKLIIIVTVIAVILIAIVIVLVWWWRGSRADMRSRMETAYLSGIEYIQGDNFIRAKEELDTAYGLAADLRDKKSQSDIDSHRKLAEAVIYADGLLQAEDFESALSAYRAAENQSRYADNLASGYIEDKLAKATGYVNVHDYINLGDALTDSGDFANAEEKYLQARSTATRFYYAAGKQAATDALNGLYQKMQEEIEARKAAADESAKSEVAAAEFIVEGDNAMRDGDTVGAKLFYQLAREKYAEMGNETIVSSIDEKLALVDAKNVQNEGQAQYAEDYVQAGDDMAGQEEYVDAKRFYLLAREIYANLADTDKLAEVQAKIDIVDVYLLDSNNGGSE
jgi:serine/threonine protein phosphatase PrpC/flagellar basal body-associated protein FliL